MRKPKVGIVGLGNIAQKAYLPILANHPLIDLVGAFSPNTSKRERICQTFRMAPFETLSDLASSIDAAFVHSSTETHYEVVSFLLNHGVDVYVDKPLAATLEEGERLVEQAERLERKLMVGFNRRFAPMYIRLQQECQPHMIDVVKHRESGIGPQDVTFTLLDDYLHVVDTLRFLAGNELRLVSGQIEVNDKLELHFARHVWQDEHGMHTTSMHRSAGANHEHVSIIRDGERLSVDEMVTLHRFKVGRHEIETFGSWESMLTQRGFQGAIDHFVSALIDDTEILTDGRVALETQRLVTNLFT
ncbi:Gfo/Idh/MocA family oxidoreductase [Exiguobacterium marinum]|uniref:Gfo/Idh/MocA family oxidoreductase n=1 Tax=Exiguobacterium marinum TaxID=273528 RepID=A0ABY7X474_9BACL|nr:Gfo/Idh/MocA family oxidoreductase [Exiguobacterium marinum]WDH75709.1 Gfo/Idh/MocA family oxidoreductase [Exiguobacterium marinum]